MEIVNFLNVVQNSIESASLEIYKNNFGKSPFLPSFVTVFITYDITYYITFEFLQLTNIEWLS